ncbi:hypothetical protein NPIL_90411, partial [Nephila pilipes]
EKNWRWWIWGNLRRPGFGDEGVGRPQARIRQTGQTSAQDGSGRAQKAAR